ncbi:MAG: thiolase family protein [Dehalococcoidia bacterium]|nr:MAG: thiolase family protein [Dehalococcoidia bacterium]
MAEPREVVIVDYARSPHGSGSSKKPGFFSHMRGDDLAVRVVEELLKRTGIDRSMVDEVTMGSPNLTGEQANPVRSVSLMTCPFETRGLSVDRACTSSMAGAHFGIMAIQLGLEDIVISGGFESCSHFPIPLWTADTDMEKMMEDAIATGATARGLPNPKLFDVVDIGTMIAMGNTAENLSEKFDIPKEDQDHWAWQSNMRAAAAQKEGKFKHEIIPMEGQFPDGSVKVVDYDEEVRPDSSLEKIKSLPAVYKPDGRVTAASSSKQADAAGAAVFMAKEKARELGLVPMVTVRSIAWVGCDPAIMGYSATLSAQKAVERAGLKPTDIDLWESNAAFAVVPLTQIKVMGLDPERMNVNGDACCIGHPIGASGIRMVGTLAHEMNRRGSRYGCAAICGGFGQGTAMVVEREDYWDGRRAWLS